MGLSPLFLEQLEAAARMERKAIIENLLKFRFNYLDEKLKEIISPILLLSPEEFTSLILQSSRKEL